MTLDGVLVTARLRELHALEHIRFAITANATDGDWVYCVSAIDARLRELEALLQREDPELVRTCEQRLDVVKAPRRTPQSEKELPIQDSFPAVATSPRMMH